MLDMFTLKTDLKSASAFVSAFYQDVVATKTYWELTDTHKHTHAHTNTHTLALFLW